VKKGLLFCFVVLSLSISCSSTEANVYDFDPVANWGSEYADLSGALFRTTTQEALSVREQDAVVKLLHGAAEKSISMGYLYFEIIDYKRAVVTRESEYGYYGTASQAINYNLVFQPISDNAAKNSSNPDIIVDAAELVAHNREAQRQKAANILLIIANGLDESAQILRSSNKWNR